MESRLGEVGSYLEQDIYANMSVALHLITYPATSLPYPVHKLPSSLQDPPCHHRRAPILGDSLLELLAHVNLA